MVFVLLWFLNFPFFLGTKTLTLMTAFWSVCVLVFSFLAKNNFNWLWLVSLSIIFQYLTDLLDGAVGRYRNRGLVKWGYYMDHFLDYVFLSCIWIGYSFILPSKYDIFLFFLLMLSGGFMVNSFLLYPLIKKYKLSYLGIGPSEIRIVFIFINTLFIFFGKTHLAFMLPYLLIVCAIGLFFSVFNSQKKLYELDMEKNSKN
jgi:phosphatidylglycerophosphate synthase